MRRIWEGEKQRRVGRNKRCRKAQMSLKAGSETNQCQELEKQQAGREQKTEQNKTEEDRQNMIDRERGWQKTAE